MKVQEVIFTLDINKRGNQGNQLISEILNPSCYRQTNING